MRKAHLQAELSRLRGREQELVRERDGLLGQVTDAVASLRADVAGLADKADRHGKALAKHGDDLAGLARAVQASLLGRAEDKPADPPPAVTPIKRGTKAAG